MIVEDQSNQFNTSPMVWDQFPSKYSQPQVIPQRVQRGYQSSKTQLHGTYTIFWVDPSNQNKIRYDITLNKDKSLNAFILDAADFFSENSTTFSNLFSDIETVKLYIAKENGNKSSTYPPVSIREVPSVFTLFKTQRKRFFLLETTSDEDNENQQESNSNSTNSSEMLIKRAPKESQNYRSQYNSDKITSIYSDKLRNSKVYNNSFHSQTNSIKDNNQSLPNKNNNNNNNMIQQKPKKQSWMCFCYSD